MKGASKMAWQVKALVVVKPDHSSLIPRIHTSEGKSDFYKLSRVLLTYVTASVYSRPWKRKVGHTHLISGVKKSCCCLLGMLRVRLFHDLGIHRKQKQT